MGGDGLQGNSRSNGLAISLRHKLRELNRCVGALQGALNCRSVRLLLLLRCNVWIVAVLQRQTGWLEGTKMNEFLGIGILTTFGNWSRTAGRNSRLVARSLVLGKRVLSPP